MKRLTLITLAILVATIALAESRAEKILKELKNPKSNYVIVASHRGDWRNFPENSLEAYRSAIEMGVDIVEIDIHRTADGHLVVCHDKTINRTTNGKGKIVEITLDSIRKCCLRTGHNIKVPKYHMPTLEEVLDAVKDKAMINIDKGFDYYDQILPLLQERNMVEQVVIKSNYDTSKIHNQYDRHDTNIPYMPVINYTKKRWDSNDSYLFDTWLGDKIPLAYEICWDGSLSGEQEVFDRVIKAKSRLWVNTLWDSLCGGEKDGFEDDRALYGNCEKIYGTLLKCGVTMIQTDRPAMLIEYLTKSGRHTLK